MKRYLKMTLLLLLGISVLGLMMIIGGAVYAYVQASSKMEDYACADLDADLKTVNQYLKQKTELLGEFHLRMAAIGPELLIKGYGLARSTKESTSIRFWDRKDWGRYAHELTYICKKNPDFNLFKMTGSIKNIPEAREKVAPEIEKYLDGDVSTVEVDPFLMMLADSSAIVGMERAKKKRLTDKYQALKNKKEQEDK